MIEGTTWLLCDFKTGVVSNFFKLAWVALPFKPNLLLLSILNYSLTHEPFGLFALQLCGVMCLSVLLSVKHMTCIVKHVMV